MALYNADIRIGVTGKAQLNQLEAQLKRTQTTLNKLNKSLNLRTRVQAVRLDVRQANTAIRNLEQRINRLGRTITVNLRVNEKEGSRPSNSSSTAIVNNQSSSSQNAALTAALATSKALTQSERERKEINQQLNPLLDQQAAKQKEIAAQVAKIKKNRTEAKNVQDGFGTPARLNQLDFGYSQLIRKLRRLRSEYNNVSESVRNYQRAADRVNDREIIRAEKRRQRLNDLRRKRQSSQNLKRAAGAGAGVGLLGGPLGNIAGGALAGGSVGGPKGAIIGATVAGVTELAGALGTLGQASAKTYAELQLQRRALANTVETAEEYEEALKAIRGVTDDFLVPLDQSTKNFTQLNAAARASGFTVKEVEEVYRGLAAANTALGGDAERLQGILLATQQVFSKGKVQAEELRGQIGERLAGAFAKFAESAGLSTSELDKALENGEVSLEDFVRFAKSMLEEYEDNAKKIADAPEKSGQRLELAMKDLQRELGPITQNIGQFFQDMATTIVDALTRALAWINRTRLAMAETDVNALISSRTQLEARLATMRANQGDGWGQASAKEIAEVEKQLKRVTQAAKERQAQLNALRGGGLSATGKGLPNKPEEEKDEPDKPTKSEINKLARDRDRLQRAMQSVQNAEVLLALETKIERAKREQNERQVVLLEGEKEILQIRQRVTDELVGVTDQKLRQALMDKAAIDALRVQERTLTRLAELDRERTQLIKEQVEEQKPLFESLRARKQELERVQNQSKDPTNLMGRVQELMKDGVSFSEAWETEKAIDDANELNEQLKRTDQIIANVANGAGQALLGVFDALVSGTEDWNSVLTDTLRSLANVLMQAGLSALGGGDGKGFFSILSGGFGGGRASGGPVSGGKSYVVGEKGPELFVPGKSGTIIPNGAGGGTNVNIVVNQNGTSTSSVSGQNADDAAKLARMVEASTMAVLTRERRPGGLLNR